ncbi:hypothetical protein A2617_03185 [Candidatus Daviesbacteria bacterium RIFOXYD1_FULL_41_10]|nr:MAG: hypothetical protein A2617_03185 [Candidatus Daviesbacteria bacterium RIFOXYD1_FULL_41_10]
MAELLAKNTSKFKTFKQGDKTTGQIISRTDSDIIVDIGAKAEGILSKKDFAPDALSALKIGQNIESFVVSSETDGQILLSLYPPRQRGGGNSKKWQKVSQAWCRKTTLQGQVLEANKGGYLIEAEGVRGFLPASQSSIETKVGDTIPLTVLEIDEKDNRLIFSSRRQLSKEMLLKLAKIEVGQEITGKLVVVAPFGLIVTVDGLEGIVLSREISWEDENFAEEFQVGQEIKAKVCAKDETLGKLNLSIRQLSEDPFKEISQKFQVDDVVTGTVTQITRQGADIKLEGEVGGFLPSEKMEGSSYQIGQKGNFLVDNVDLKRRRINLAPFLTSTKGLIYK